MPENDYGKTHYDGCWRHHIECARATMQDIEHLFPEIAEEAARKEREACAAVAMRFSHDSGARVIAGEIRARVRP